MEVDPAGGGKYLFWWHRFPPTKDGRRQDLRIGPYPRISLKAARDIRNEQTYRLHLIEPGPHSSFIHSRSGRRLQQWDRCRSDHSSRNYASRRYCLKNRDIAA
ncbi:Arm DNA-binding domain-containing protein [Synechococcus sp. CBW1002]|uniref:Arm DNA-binding domain-containing protein n=1 Tax=Synechococcus sp. CBW1002 TaxID=1353134 RepID=UPI00351C09CB